MVLRFIALIYSVMLRNKKYKYIFFKKTKKQFSNTFVSNLCKLKTKIREGLSVMISGFKLNTSSIPRY